MGGEYVFRPRIEWTVPDRSGKGFGDALTGSPNDLLRKAKMTGSCITATAGASAARPVATPCRAGQPTSSASPAVSPPPGMPPFPAAAAAAAAPPFLPAVVAWLLGGGGADGGADVL
eukprot:scaffold6622_cov73-Isochrysis_galbana.AAC.3